jgi:hypothetical protein
MKKSLLLDTCHRIIIDDFMPEDQLVVFNKQFCSLYEESVPGVVVKPGAGVVVDTNIKSRMEFNVYDLSKELGLDLHSIWNNCLWREELRSFYAQCGGIFSYMNVTSYDYLLGAFYSEGDFYKPHPDLSILTAVFFHQDENNFEGGNFYLGSGTEWNKNDLRYVKIEYKKNRLLIFPSRFMHYAEPVTKSKKDGIDGMRLCTQNFLSFKNEHQE